MSTPQDLILPFRGIRYDETIVGNLDKVVCPPYDVISPEDRILYHNLSPHNFVRLVLGEEFDTDGEVSNRFTRAKEYLAQWLETGALKQDPEPSLYLYEQRFVRDGRPHTVRGLTCAVKLHEYADQVVLPHENTLAAPKPQLAVLLRQTQANLDGVYGLYADEQGIVDELLAPFAAREPDMDVRDRDDVQHRLWLVSEPKSISHIQGFFADKQIAIADGHHRYETALAYRNERREGGDSEITTQRKEITTRKKAGGDSEITTQGKETTAQGKEITTLPDRPVPSDYVLMTIANVHQQDLTVLPTHRIASNLEESAVAGLQGRIGDMFTVRRSTAESLVGEMAECGSIGMYMNGSAFLLSPSDGAYALMQGSAAYRKLELNLLHSLVFERALGITQEQMRNQTCIFYTRDPAEAISKVDCGEAQMAFLLNEISVKTILDIAAAGERLPQKATYFYPKLLSGLCLRRLDQ